jgi:uncharacterized protein with HEPN domain
VKDDRAYLLHIRDAIDRILAYTAGGRDAFFADPKTQDAVIRNIEIIGQATKNLSSTVKESHPDVPWKKIAGMRDKMIHEYFGVSLRMVWEAVEHDIPAFRKQVLGILSALPSSEPGLFT